MKVFFSAAEVAESVGSELGRSDWVVVTQDQIDAFGEATGDQQWIHVDVDRARRESPYGGPIAHGYLSLSLLPMLGWQIFKFEGARMGINYGSNRVRFPAPVPVGARVRLRSVLKRVEELHDGSIQVVMDQTLEIDGHDKPAVVAETISRVAF